MLALAFTLLQLQSEGMRIYCRMSGYDAGACWAEKKCACFDYKDYFETSQRKIIKIPKRKKVREPKPVPTVDARDYMPNVWRQDGE